MTAMPTLDDVRAIAMAFPGVEEKESGHTGGPTWRTSRGLVVWERPPTKADLTTLDALGREWPNGPVVAVHTDGIETKEALIESFPDAFFTIPHFDGYPAVLVTLEAIDPAQLTEVITDSWLERVPKRVASQWLAEHGADPEA